ncbi:MAG: Gfo/Idh/MocA family oxidoreductase [Bacilli bacterium]
MKKIKIGVLCPSEIAFRRFMPALLKIDSAEFIGIAHANEEEWFGSVSSAHNLNIIDKDKEKAFNFVSTYGGKVFNSFNEIIISKEVDAIYIPLPPALHFKWAKLALLSGKHVFVEKPSTTDFNNTRELVEIANENDLAICENYMFIFHNQIDAIEDLIKENAIGKVRLFRIAFGFPFRGEKDFRYSKELGGGALLDCGGYTLKLARRLLGDSISLVTHQLNYEENYKVDIGGSATLINKQKEVAQISFGMDNSYKCELEVWGSKGILLNERIFTAPDTLKSIIQIKNNSIVKEIKLDEDNSFQKSIEYFIKCIFDKKTKEESYKELLLQSTLIEQFKEE